jgi:hypothetical protein
MKKYVVRTESFQSSSNPKKKYVTTIWSDGSMSCDCPGWILHSKRSCKHTILVEQRQKKKQGTPPMVEKRSFKGFNWLIEAEIEVENLKVDIVRGRMITYLSPAWQCSRFGIVLLPEEIDFAGFSPTKVASLKTKEKLWALWASTPEEAKGLYENLVESDLRPISQGGKTSYIDNKRVTILKEKNEK